MSAAPSQRIVGFEPALKVQESPTAPSRFSASTPADMADDSVYRSLYIGSDFAVVAQKQAPSSVFSPRSVPSESPQSVGPQVAWITSAVINETAQRVLTDRSKAQVYGICVESDKFTGYVWHRYSEFRQLYTRLVERYGHGLVPQIPGKKYNKFSERVVSHRMATLNTFLEGIVNSQLLRESDEVKAFLTTSLVDEV